MPIVTAEILDVQCLFGGLYLCIKVMMKAYH